MSTDLRWMTMTTMDDDGDDDVGDGDGNGDHALQLSRHWKL